MHPDACLPDKDTGINIEYFLPTRRMLRCGSAVKFVEVPKEGLRNVFSHLKLPGNSIKVDILVTVVGTES